MASLSGFLTGFERFWNSSFGLPQQLLFRAARVASGDASFFSEEGFGDASLIPGFGAFDAERKDVKGDEMVRRVNQVFGTELDEEGFGAQLAVGIGTDPLSFLTSGLTAAGKAGGAVLKGINKGAVKAVLGATRQDEILALGKTKVMKGLDDALEAPAGAMKGSDRRAIQAARKALDDIPDENLIEGVKQAGKREQLLALPIIGAHGPKIAVSDQYRSWFQLFRDKGGVNTAAAYMTSGPLQNVPVLRHITGAIAGTAAGVRSAGLASRALQLNAKAEGEDLLALSNVVNQGGKLARAIEEGPRAERILNAAKRGQTRSFIKSVLGRHPKSPEEAPELLEEALDLLGVSSLDEVTDDTLEMFLVRHEQDVTKLQALNRSFELTEQAVENLEIRDLPGADPFFRLGRKIEMGRRRMFVSDAPGFKDIDDHVKAIRGMHARNTQQVSSYAELGKKLLVADAKALGANPEDLETIISLTTQMDTLEQSLMHATKSKKTGQQFEDFVFQLDDASRRLKATIAPLTGKGSESLDDIYEHLQRSVGDGLLDDLRIKGEFDGPHQTIRVEAGPAPGGVAQNQHIVMSEGPVTGRYLGNLTDRQLSKLRAKLAGKGTRKRTQQELARVVTKTPELKAASKALGISSDELADLARRRGGTKGFPRLERLELDELERNVVGAAANGQYRSLPFQDKVSVVTRLFKGGRVPAKFQAVAAEMKPLVQMLRSKGFKDVEDVVDLLTLARGKRVTRLAPGVQNMNDLAKPLVAVSKALTKQLDAPIFDRKILTAQELKDYDAATTLHSLRKQDVNPVRREGTGRARKIREQQPARNLEGTEAGVALDDGEFLNLNVNPATAQIGRILQLRKELVRVGGGNVSPALMMDIAEETGRLSEMLVSPIKKSLRQAGASRFYDFSDQVRRDVLAEALENGVLGDEAPLAYLGRIFQKDEQKALDDLLGKPDTQELIDRALPTMGSQYGRSANSMTIQELNELYIAAAEAKNHPLKAELAAYMEKRGFKAGLYEESPLNAMLARLSQSQQRKTASDVITGMLDEGAKEGVVIGGKVVDVVYEAGTKRSGQVGEVGKPRRTAKVAGREENIVDVDIEATPREKRVQSIIIEDHTGKQVAIAVDELGYRISGLRLGKLDYGDEGGMAINKAFARRTGQGGKLADNEVFGRTAMSPEALTKLKGEYIFLGEEQAWSSMFESFAKQWDEGPAIMVAADTGISLMKRFQTVFRPVFHLFNQIGAYPMAMSAGATPMGLMRGTADVARFLSSAADQVQWYDRVQTLAGPGRSGFVGKVLNPFQDTVETVRRAGTSGFRSTEEAAKAAGVTAEDMLFHASNGQVYDLGEMLDVMDKHNLFTGFVAEGLRSTSSTPQRLRAIREAMINPDSFKARTGEAWHKLNDVTEGSENNARMMTFFSLLQSGQGMDEAARNTLAAMVPYHQLTRFERTFMKRAFTYYSFPRHYTGQAYRYFATRPDVGARYAHTITAQGGVVERDGRLVIDTGAGELNVGRLDPNLEALGTLKAFGELFTDAAALFNSEAASISRQRDALGRRQEPPITPGAPFNMGVSLLQGDAKGFLEEAGNAFWISRFIMADADPLGETSPMTQLLEATIKPLKTSRPEQTKRIAVARFNQLKRELQQNLKTYGDDPELVAAYTRELGEVEAALISQLEGK